MEFAVLGPLEVTAYGQSLGLAGARTRAVLAILLVHANRVVSSDRLIEELWPGRPAGRAAGSLQVRLSELRRTLRSAGEAGRLATRPPGYLLQVAPGELDALRFGQLAAEGDVALAAGDAVTAVRRFDQALGLWRGAALAGFDAVPSARTEAGRWKSSAWPRWSRGPKRCWPAVGTSASVQITDRVAALARPAEILVSRTVKDLVTGSGISFADRGRHALDGPSEHWSLFAVMGLPAAGSG